MIFIFLPHLPKRPKLVKHFFFTDLTGWNLTASSLLVQIRGITEIRNRKRSSANSSGYLSGAVYFLPLRVRWLWRTVECGHASGWVTGRYARLSFRMFVLHRWGSRAAGTVLLWSGTVGDKAHTRRVCAPLSALTPVLAVHPWLPTLPALRLIN